MKNKIEIKNVSKSFGQYHILKSLDFSLDLGLQYVIQGASGSGKSTLLYLLGGLDKPSSGNIYVDGININNFDDSQLANYRNQYVGFVFQFHFLLSSMNFRENILLPAKIGAQSNFNALGEKVNKMAEILDVKHCLDKFPKELSGGEQQRVNIIRALLQGPKLLLCDEPTGNLDSENSSKVISLIIELAQEYEATLVVVTHDGDVASRFGKCFNMIDGQMH